MAEQGINREISAYKLRILHEEYCPVGQHFSWGLFEWAAQNFICLVARFVWEQSPAHRCILSLRV